MFGPITLPFGAKMLFNTVTLKPGITFEDIELAVGELCSVVKETYGGDKGGFLAGQVFRFSGFVSEVGPLSASKTAENHYGLMRTNCSRASLPRSPRCAPTRRNWATTCSGRARPNSGARDRAASDDPLS